MKFSTTRTKGNWLSLEPTSPDEDVKDREEMLRRSLVELLQAEHLIVLCGLGTSLCIRNDSSRLAPTMLDLWNAAEQKAGKQFDSVLSLVRFPEVKTDEDKDIELLLSKCQLSEALESNPEIQSFIKETEALIVEKCDFLPPNMSLPVHESFLRRIARRSTRSPRTELFTTNYDLCFEHVASRLRFIAIDGFSHSAPQSFDSSFFSYDLVYRDDTREAPNYIPNVFHLCKLHGSIDWDRNEQEVRRVSRPKNPVLIYPRNTKFESSYEPPFLDLMARFQSALRRPKTALLVIGFGFRDKHLAEPILGAIRSNVGLQLALVDPSLETSDNPAFVQMRSLVQSGDPRICLVAAKFEEFVAHIPDLVATTEEEKHLERIRGASRA